MRAYKMPCHTAQDSICNNRKSRCCLGRACQPGHFATHTPCTRPAPLTGILTMLVGTSQTISFCMPFCICLQKWWLHVCLNPFWICWNRRLAQCQQAAGKVSWQNTPDSGKNISFWSRAKDQSNSEGKGVGLPYSSVFSCWLCQGFHIHLAFWGERVIRS